MSKNVLPFKRKASPRNPTKPKSASVVQEMDYGHTCSLKGCGAEAKWTVVAKIWAKITPNNARTKDNCLKMACGVVACDEHRSKLPEVVVHFMKTQADNLNKAIRAANRGEPDLDNYRSEILSIEEAKNDQQMAKG